MKTAEDALVLDYYGLLPDYVSSTNFKIKCPFHAENVESLNVSIDNGIFYCFGCGAKGDFIDLISELENINRLKAMQKYYKITDDADKVDFSDLTEEKDTAELLKRAKNFYINLKDDAWGGDDRYAKYMTNHRAFNPKTLEEAGVKINRSSEYPIVIPIYEQGVFKGYIVRRVDSKEPKYLYNKGFMKKKTLAGNIMRGIVLIVEGMTDLLRAIEFGFHNVAALLGWKISNHQYNILNRHAELVISALDNSERGHEGSQILEKKFKDRYIRFAYPFNDNIEDIADIKNKDIFKHCLTRTKNNLRKGE